MPDRGPTLLASRLKDETFELSASYGRVTAPELLAALWLYVDHQGGGEIDQVREHVTEFFAELARAPDPAARLTELVERYRMNAPEKIEELGQLVDEVRLAGGKSS